MIKYFRNVKLVTALTALLAAGCAGQSIDARMGNPPTKVHVGTIPTRDGNVQVYTNGANIGLRLEYRKNPAKYTK